MFPIDNSTAVTTLPTPAAAGTPGYFTNGNPGAGVPATIVPADWLNGVQGEILGVLAAANIDPDKTLQDQLAEAIKKLSAGRYLGTTVFESSSTFQKQQATTLLRVRGCGGGGAGGNTSTTGSAQSSVSAGGLCGAAAEVELTDNIDGVIPVTIGAGGLSSGALGSAGVAGGTTMFGALLSLPGGHGGLGCGVKVAPFITFSGGSVLLPTCAGTILWSTGTANIATGGMALNANTLLAGAGGFGKYGFPNSGHGAGGNGQATFPNSSGEAGDAGNPGFLIVEEWAF